MIETVISVSVSHPLNRASPDLKVRRNGIFPASFVGEEHNASPGDDARIVFSSSYDTLYLGDILTGELYDVLVWFVHIHQHIMQRFRFKIKLVGY